MQDEERRAGRADPPGEHQRLSRGVQALLAVKERVEAQAAGVERGNGGEALRGLPEGWELL